MQLRDSRLVLSASDLSNFRGCHHRTALDMAAAYGALARHYEEDPLLELLWQRGAEHERQYVDSLRAAGLTFCDVREASQPIDATLEAMRDAVDVIVQGALGDDRWFGRPDVMRRVDSPSALGSWSYEIFDTKLARETRAGTILQLGLYSELLAEAQGARPTRFHVVTPSEVAPVTSYRVDDYAAYFRQTRARMLAATARDFVMLAREHYPEPVDHCEICQWRQKCVAKRHADDHLSLVANITRGQRRELEMRSIETVAQLAVLPVPIAFKPKRGSVESYNRVRDQARLQVESRDKMPPLHELLAIEPQRGLCRLPEPDDGDLFLDLEGDAFGADGNGREYLFGLARSDGSYVAQWALTDTDERSAFESMMDTIVAAAAERPAMHVYHYAPYEQTAFKRLMGRYATRDQELDVMLRAGRFVDLYAVVRQGIRAGVERYSIKNLEPLYAFTRDVPLNAANRGLKAIEVAMGMGTPIPDELRSIVEGYNRDDCVSTLRLRDWLEGVRGKHIASGVDIPRMSLVNGEPPPDVDAKAKRVAELRGRLLQGVSEFRVNRDEDAQAKWLLAFMLDYHRREARSTWWEFFRLCDLADEDLIDERAALTGMTFVGRIDETKHKKTGKPTGTVTDRYRYPEQEMEIEADNSVVLQDKSDFGRVVAVDRLARTIDVRKVMKHKDTHPRAMFSFKIVRTDELENSLARLAEFWLTKGADSGVARALLIPGAPRLSSGEFAVRADETESAFAIRVGPLLDETVLAVQGPPGSGKTYTGARMICELVRRGKKVGVTAASHKVIRLLLDAVARAAAEAGIDVRLAHKCDDDDIPGDPGSVGIVGDNPGALDGLQTGDVNVLGGTAWLWSRPEFAHSVDVLFIDEAGQLALANALAVSQSAKGVVLLGDPRQLEQPTKGSHPDGVDVSALEHILAGAQTIPSDRGIFLPVTWRLSPSICAFTSELFYENRLKSRDAAARQSLLGPSNEPIAGLSTISVEHDGNKNYSMEEVEAVAALVARLTNGPMWRSAENFEAPIAGSDILVVAPYNAHVSRLAAKLEGTGVRIGTVDKFQGQEAPVVIYSMATSRPEDAPRGMEFLYSLNRLNVATSRAKCLAVLVASPHLFEPECKSPRHMHLANALCRFREMAVPLST